MGVSQQRRYKVTLGQNNNALTWLIIINASAFVLINFIKIVYFFSDTPKEFFYSQVLSWFSLPAAPDKLITRPWVLLTYMVSHENIWSLIRNLLWLWGFGYIMQDLAGNNKLFPAYIYGGLTGASFFLLSVNLLPSLSQHIDAIQPMLGAGSAVMAVAIATTTFAPDYRIFPMLNGGIPLWVIALIFVAIDYAAIASSPNGAANAIAHLASGIVGYIYVRQVRRGSDWGIWMLNLVNWTDDLFNPEKKHKQIAYKEQHFYKASKTPFEKTPNVTQKKLDEILDKINQKGYYLLTDEEKEYLKKASKDI